MKSINKIFYALSLMIFLNISASTDLVNKTVNKIAELQNVEEQLKISFREVNYLLYRLTLGEVKAILMRGAAHRMEKLLPNDDANFLNDKLLKLANIIITLVAYLNQIEAQFIDSLNSISNQNVARNLEDILDPTKEYGKKLDGILSFSKNIMSFTEGLKSLVISTVFTENLLRGIKPILRQEKTQIQNIRNLILGPEFITFAQNIDGEITTNFSDILKTLMTAEFTTAI